MVWDIILMLDTEVCKIDDTFQGKYQISSLLKPSFLIGIFTSRQSITVEAMRDVQAAGSQHNWKQGTLLRGEIKPKGLCSCTVSQTVYILSLWTESSRDATKKIFPTRNIFSDLGARRESEEQYNLFLSQSWQRKTIKLMRGEGKMPAIIIKIIIGLNVYN